MTLLHETGSGTAIVIRIVNPPVVAVQGTVIVDVEIQRVVEVVTGVEFYRNPLESTGN